MKFQHAAVGVLPVVFALIGTSKGVTVDTRQTASKDDMVLIKKGTFIMGNAKGAKNEQLTHSVSLAPFWMDKTPVTSDAFERFVRETGYKTDAEKRGASLVYRYDAAAPAPVKGADWRHPEGPGSTLLPDEPVCQVSWNDANAFAK